MLRDIQKGINFTNPSATQKVLSVIRACITRWTAHYLSYHRLLDLLNPLKILVAQERGRGNNPHIIVGDAASRRKAGKMLELIENPLFWHTLARYIFYHSVLNLTIQNIIELSHISSHWHWL